MSRRAVGVAIAVVAGLCVAVIAAGVWRHVASGPPIETQALGIWQEQTASRPLRLTISAGPDQGGQTGYWVTGGDAAEPLQARLDGDKIVVGTRDAVDAVWIISYGKGADALIVTGPATGERHILRRVSK